MTRAHPTVKPAGAGPMIDSNRWKRFLDSSDVDISPCWTCGSCDFECPVNVATGRLRPQKIVRMAALGMIEELLCLDEIWYCQQCRRCEQTCPNAVAPGTVIEHIRAEMLSRKLISRPLFQQHRDLFARFQRVRWRAAAAAMKDPPVELTESRWKKWLATPLPPPPFRVISGDVTQAFSTFREPMQQARILRCLTCGECSSACPISGHRDVFDPRALFRMVHLGLAEELLRSPSLWLCLGCGRCTKACTQKVDGLKMIHSLQDTAFRSGAVDNAFFLRLDHLNKQIYPWLIAEIDKRFEFCSPQAESCVRRAYG